MDNKHQLVKHCEKLNSLTHNICVDIPNIRCIHASLSWHHLNNHNHNWKPHLTRTRQPPTTHQTQQQVYHIIYSCIFIPARLVTHACQPTKPAFMTLTSLTGIKIKSYITCSFCYCVCGWIGFQSLVTILKLTWDNGG